MGEHDATYPLSGEDLYGKNQALGLELATMADRDESFGRQWLARPGVSVVARGLVVRYKNTRCLKRIIEQSGWPTRTQVGLLGSQAAWLIAQHADHDRRFQKQCLDLLETAVQRGEGSLQHLAYLTDRVRVAEGRPQRFGTQFHGGKMPVPIEDETHVDERRAAVGLTSMSEYRHTMRETVERSQVGQGKGFRAAIHLLRQVFTDAETIGKR